MCMCSAGRTIARSSGSCSGRSRITDEHSSQPPSNANVVEAALRGGLPARTFLNLNVPPGQPKGLRVTFQAKRNHVTVVDPRQDPRGRPYYWIEEGENEWEPHDRSDYQAIKDGFVSVTPLQVDLTAYSAIGLVETLLGQQLSERGEQLLLDPRVEVE